MGLMHYTLLVIMPGECVSPADAKAHIGQALAPFSENDEVEEYRRTCDDCGGSGCGWCDGRGWEMSTYNPRGKWDWWVIGGRWTGMFSDYDPGTDPENFEPCLRCSGPGCDWCRGTGRTRRLFNVARDEHNIVPVERVLSCESPSTYAVLTPDGAWHEKPDGAWSDAAVQAQWVDGYVNILRPYAAGHVAVLVDYHS